jgi:excisionase family DNA binding protein
VSDLLVDLAANVAVALHRHRSALRSEGLAEHPWLAELESVALQVASSGQQASTGVSVSNVLDDDLHERLYLDREDIHRLAGVSVRTVDRWISSGRLRSAKRGNVRRVSRQDLSEFLEAA